MKKIYIIGSLTRHSIIRDMARFIELNGDFEVEYVHRELKKIKETLISECFTKIEQADIIIAVKKRNNILGDGTLYEIEYACRCKKHVIITSGNNFPELFIQLCI